MADSTVRIGGALVDVTTRYRIGGILVPAKVVAPTAPTAGLLRSWRADSITGVANGAAITSITYTDGTVLTPSTAAPTYLAAGLGGQPALRLIRASSQALAKTTGVPSRAQPVTLVMIAQPKLINSTAGGDLMIYASGASECYIGSSDRLGMWGGGSGMDATTSVTADAPILIEATYAGASSALAVNGNQLATGNVTGNGLGTAIYFGRASNGRHFDGLIAEVFEYDHNLTAAERTQLRQYVAARYGITVAGI